MRSTRIGALAAAVFLLVACPQTDGPDNGTGGGTAGGTASGGGSATGIGGGTAGGDGGGTAGGDGGGNGGGGGPVVADAGVDGGVDPIDMTDAGMPSGDLVEVASLDKNFATLIAAVDKAGLTATLKDATKKRTLFAPTNKAFEALLGSLGLKDLSDLSPAQLKPILLYHVLGSEVRASEALALAAKNAKNPSLGGVIALSLSSKQIQIDERALVTAANIFATNGVIHAVDAVLLPSVTDIVTTSDDFTSLKASVLTADKDASAPKLAEALDNDKATLTVFAPNDSAFKGLLKLLLGFDQGVRTGVADLKDLTPSQLVPILKYHVHGKAKLTAKQLTAAVGPLDMLGGRAAIALNKADALTIDSTGIAAADLYASNAVIHVLSEKVLLPSVLDIVNTDPQFAGMKKLVEDADKGSAAPFASFLDGKGAVTFMTPNNKAVAAAGALKQPLGTLQYHLIPNPLFQSNLKKCEVGQPLCAFGTSYDSGGKIKQMQFFYSTKPTPAFSAKDPVVATPAQIVELNLFAEGLSSSVSVIHVIDRVLVQ